MQRGDRGARDTETDADEREGRPVEEDADEEAEGDEPAAEEDAQRRARVQEDEGRADREGEDHAARDLVERGIDVLEGIVAEAVAEGQYLSGRERVART